FFFVLACFCRIVGADQLSSRLMGPAVVAGAVAFVAPALGGAMRALLATPEVQGALCVLLGLAVVVGLIVLASKAAMVDVRRPPMPAMPLKERTPVTPPQPETPPWGEVGNARPSPARDTDDDLGMFGSSRRRR
ncbi:MAG: hypothetical protein ACOZNI_19455, partial [Myxococcota bacterium]